MTKPTLLRAIEAAKYLRLSRSTLAKWRKRQIGPPHIKNGERIVVYALSDLDEWISNGRRP